MNAQVKVIPCDIYKRGIYVFIGTLVQLKSWATKRFNNSNNGDLEFLKSILNTNSDSWDAAEYFYCDDTGEGIVRINQYPKTPDQYEELVHELLHATLHILDFCDVEYTRGSSHEAFTYLLGYLTRNALRKDGYEIVKED